MPRPFFVAWVDPTETTFDPVAHLRYDETVLNFSGEHKEGLAPTLQLTIVNPFTGLLSLSRKQWLWLSWVNPATSVIEPIFFGQVVGVPSGMAGEKMTISLLGKPLDYVPQQQAIAAALKVAPYYDPLFIAVEYRDNPDTILEGYARRWHVDRKTLVVSTSDVVNGEDGTDVFTNADGFYNSLDVSISQPPINQVQVSASTFFTQTGSGSIDLGNKTIVSYTGDKLMGDWPKTGQQLAGGYSVALGEAVDVYNVGDAKTVSHSFEWKNMEDTHVDGDVMSVSTNDNGPTLRSGGISVVTSFYNNPGFIDPDAGINVPATQSMQKIVVPLWTIATKLKLDYSAARKRTETITFTLNADLQPILTAAAGAQAWETISLPANDAGVPIDGVAPVANSSQGSYFDTDRGSQSCQYAIAVGRAHLLAGSRVATVSRRCRFERAIALSCRKNAQIFDRRLAGGSAIGKVVAYTFSANVTAGLYDGSVTIACTIGTGGTVTGLPGTDTYIDGYIDAGFFYQAGQSLAFPSGDVAFTPPAPSPADLVFPLTPDQVVVSEAILGSSANQASAINSGIASAMGAGGGISLLWPSTTQQSDLESALGPAIDAAMAAATNADVYYDLQLKSLTADIAVAYDLTVTNLAVPKQIDLAA